VITRALRLRPSVTGWAAQHAGPRNRRPSHAKAGGFDGCSRVGHDTQTHVVVSGDAQPDPSIHPNNGMRAHPPDAHSDGMGAQKRAAGGREPRRYEIGVRGPIGPTMMQAFPMLAASDADLPVVGLEDAHRGDRLRLEADASRRGRQTPPSQARKRSERDGRLHTPRRVARVSFDPSLADRSLLNESLDGRCGAEVRGLACRP
jgi:hypothetical protein